jgi:hypothetical protein
MKSSWFIRCGLAVFVLALGGCLDEFDDLGPEGDIQLEHDAGRNVDPIVTTEKRDASDPKADATVPPQPKDAALVHEDAGTSLQDAAVSHQDAGDGSDAGSNPADASEPSAPSYASVYALITESCLGCHGAGKTLDLSTPELAHAGMVGISAQYSACVSDGGVSPLRVVAGEPDSSLLIAKLEGTQGCGKQMPPKALLAAEKLAVFRAWVAAGASAQ